MVFRNSSQHLRLRPEPLLGEWFSPLLDAFQPPSLRSRRPYAGYPDRLLHLSPQRLKSHTVTSTHTYLERPQTPRNTATCPRGHRFHDRKCPDHHAHCIGISPAVHLDCAAATE